MAAAVLVIWASTATLFLLDGFADGRQRFYAVAGEESGGVDQVFEPRAVGETCGVGERVFVAISRAFTLGSAESA